MAEMVDAPDGAVTKIPFEMGDGDFNVYKDLGVGLYKLLYNTRWLKVLK